MSKRGADAVEADESPINWRRTDDGIALFDVTNPDAWVRMHFEAGVAPEHRLYMICDECGAVLAQRTTPGNTTVCGDCGAAFEHRRD